VPRIAVAALIVWPVVGPTLAGVQAQVANDDTRLRTIEWLEEHAPAGTTVLIDSGTTPLPTDRYDVYVVTFGELIRWSDVHPKLRPEGYFGTIGNDWFGTPDELISSIGEAGIECIVLSDQWIDLAQNDPGMDPAVRANYEALLAEYPVVARFDSDVASLGPPVTVLGAAGCPIQPQ
jgi:hypothetical protein